MRSVHGGQLMLALLMLGIFNVLVLLRWRYMLSHTKTVASAPVFSAMMVGYFANNVLPARAGEFLRAHVLGRRTSLSRTFAFATIVVERLFDVATMLLFLLVVMAGFDLPVLARQVSIGTLSVLAVAFLALGAVLFGGDRLGKFLRLPSFYRLLAPLRTRIEPFREGLQTVGQGRRLAVVSALSILIWLTSTMMMYFTLLSLGIHIPFYGVFFTFAVVNLGLVIPSSPGFIGTYQILCIGALSFFHVPKSTALAFSIIQHAVWYVPMTLVGFTFFCRENLRLNRVASTQEATAKEATA